MEAVNAFINGTNVDRGVAEQVCKAVQRTSLDAFNPVNIAVPSKTIAVPPRTNKLMIPSEPFKLFELLKETKQEVKFVSSEEEKTDKREPNCIPAIVSSQISLEDRA